MHTIQKRRIDGSGGRRLRTGGGKQNRVSPMKYVNLRGEGERGGGRRTGGRKERGICLRFFERLAFEPEQMSNGGEKDQNFDCVNVPRHGGRRVREEKRKNPLLPP